MQESTFTCYIQTSNHMECSNNIILNGFYFGATFPFFSCSHQAMCWLAQWSWARMWSGSVACLLCGAWWPLQEPPRQAPRAHGGGAQGEGAGQWPLHPNREVILSCSFLAFQHAWSFTISTASQSKASKQILFKWSLVYWHTIYQGIYIKVYISR